MDTLESAPSLDAPVITRQVRVPIDVTLAPMDREDEVLRQAARTALRLSGGLRRGESIKSVSAATHLPPDDPDGGPAGVAWQVKAVTVTINTGPTSRTA